MSCALAAMKSSASAAGTLSLGRLMISRTLSPKSVVPGSCTCTTCTPIPRSRSASNLACVLLPAPSPPSNEMNGALNLGRVAGDVRAGAAGAGGVTWCTAVVRSPLTCAACVLLHVASVRSQRWQSRRCTWPPSRVAASAHMRFAAGVRPSARPRVHAQPRSGHLPTR